MSENNLKDKICIDTNDYPELGEFFSRKEPGDSVKGRFEASLDENADGLVILSIDDIKLQLSKADAKDTPEEDEPAAVKVYKGKTASVDDADQEEAEEADEANSMMGMGMNVSPANGSK